MLGLTCGDVVGAGVGADAGTGAGARSVNTM